MTADMRPADPRDLWQADGTAAGGLSPEALRARIDRLASATRRRNYGAFVVCALVLAICVWWFLWIDDPLSRTGALLIAASLGTIVLQVRASQMGEPAAVQHATRMGQTTLVESHRSDLERQRDFHSGWKLWARLLPLASGALMLFGGFARAHPEVASTIRWEAIAAVAMFISAVPLNLWLARRYQQQIDQLDQVFKERS